MVCRYFRAVSGASEHLRGVRSLDVDLVARGNEFAGDHLLIALPRPHHRVHTGVRVDHHFQERGSLERLGLRDDARHVLLALQAHRVTKAVRLRRLDEVLLVQRAVARRQTTLEEQLLPLLDHAVAEVVEHHHLQRRSEEHTSELQSQSNLVCRLLLEKKQAQCAIRPRGSGKSVKGAAPPCSGRSPQYPTAPAAPDTTNAGATPPRTSISPRARPPT